MGIVGDLSRSLMKPRYFMPLIIVGAMSVICLRHYDELIPGFVERGRSAQQHIVERRWAERDVAADYGIDANEFQRSENIPKRGSLENR